MTLPLYIVDAFASELFRGNPAAVCPLDHWPSDAVMQSIAAEHNLAETAFLVPEADGWRLRWFTPELEVELCGHATLASAFVLAIREPALSEFRFHTLSGLLVVQRVGGTFTLDFPVRSLEEQPLVPALEAALQCAVLHLTRSGTGAIAELESEAAVVSCRPDFAALKALPWTGLSITARGSHCDFVSRFFAPKVGINEDAVTGSAHCGLTPYWARKLSKTVLSARQLSQRGGELLCELRGDRVLMSGTAVLYSEGVIHL